MVSSTHWIDIINTYILSENHSNVAMRAGDEYYYKAFKVLKKFLLKYPMAIERHHSMLPKRNYFIRNETIQLFVMYFKKRFTFKPLQGKSLKQRKVERPNGLFNSDEALDSSFHREITSYNQLTPRERLRFVDMKDSIHEEIYGTITRFDRLPLSCAHSFITGNSNKRKIFIHRLEFAIKDVILRRNLDKSCYERSFISSEHSHNIVSSDMPNDAPTREMTPVIADDNQNVDGTVSDSEDNDDYQESIDLTMSDDESDGSSIHTEVEDQESIDITMTDDESDGSSIYTEGEDQESIDITMTDDKSDSSSIYTDEVEDQESIDITMTDDENDSSSIFTDDENETDS